MKVELSWGDRVTTKEGEATTVYSAAMSPNSEEIMVGVSSRVFVYSRKKGQIINSLRGHKGQINCVRYSPCGERFATASDDTNVIVWKKNGVGLLKYTHNAPVNTLAFCPVSFRLASGSENDIAIWCPQQSSVTKVKVAKRCISMEWSPDGVYLVTGHVDGTVWIRDQKGGEIHSFQRGGAVWAFNFCKTPHYDPQSGVYTGYPLALTSWDGTYTLYLIGPSPRPLAPDTKLGYDACAVVCVGDGVLIGGTDQRVSLYTLEGRYMKTLSKHLDWVWCLQPSAEGDQFVVCTNAGELLLFRCSPQIVHAAHSGTYAYRSHLTDVVVCALASEARVHLSTREYVSKVALYNGRLAVQLPDRILVYAGCGADGRWLDGGHTSINSIANNAANTTSADASSTTNTNTNSATSTSTGTSLSTLSTLDEPCVQYKLRHKITRIVDPTQKDRENTYSSAYHFDPSSPNSHVRGNGPRKGITVSYPELRSHPSLANQVLAVASQHVILVCERRLVAATLDGVVARSWVLDCPPRFVRVLGGSSGQESVLVALKDGSVMQYYLGGEVGYGVLLYKHSVGVRCMDVSQYRDKLAIVDNDGVLLVISLISQQTLFRDRGVVSAVWNTLHNDMLCYSGGGTVALKTGLFPPLRQPLGGVVTAFVGGRVYALTRTGKLLCHDVHLSAAVHEYLQRDLPSLAYAAACLGVSENEWRLLGIRALLRLDVDVAQRAFVRVRDSRVLQLIARMRIHLMQRGSVNGSTSASGNAAGTTSVATGMAMGGGAARNVCCLLGDVCVQLRRHREAAQLYVLGGSPREAIDLYLRLQHWSSARAIAMKMGDGAGAKALLLEQAQWMREQGDIGGACALYWESEEYTSAVSLYVEAGLISELSARTQELCSVVEVSGGKAAERAALQCCGAALAEVGEDAVAVRAYTAARDKEGAMRVLVRAGMWDEAVLLLQQHIDTQGYDGIAQSLQTLLCVPYAEWLASQGQFHEAHAAYIRAGMHTEANALMTRLVESAVALGRYTDVAHLYTIIARTIGAAVPPTLSNMGPSGNGDSVISSLTRMLSTLHRQQVEWAEEQSVLYRCYAIIDDYISHVMSQPLPRTLDALNTRVGADVGHNGSGAGCSVSGSGAPTSMSAFFASHRALCLLRSRQLGSQYLPYALPTQASLLAPLTHAYNAAAGGSGSSVYVWPDDTPIAGTIAAAAARAGRSGDNDNVLSLLGQAAVPHGIRVAGILLAFAHSATALGAFKSARVCLSRALQLHISERERASAENLMALLRQTTLTDRGCVWEHICFRCQQAIPLLHPLGDCCLQCRTPVVRCALTHTPLPLLPVSLAPSVSQQEALRVLHADVPVLVPHPLAPAGKAGGKGGNTNNAAGGAGVDAEVEAGRQAVLQQLLQAQVDTDGRPLPLRLDKQMLRALQPQWVLHCSSNDANTQTHVIAAPLPSSTGSSPIGSASGSVRARWWLKVLPGVGVWQCRRCGACALWQHAHTHAYTHGQCGVCRAALTEGEL